MKHLQGMDGKRKEQASLGIANWFGDFRAFDDGRATKKDKTWRKQYHAKCHHPKVGRYRRRQSQKKRVKSQKKAQSGGAGKARNLIPRFVVDGC